MDGRTMILNRVAMVLLLVASFVGLQPAALASDGHDHPTPEAGSDDPYLQYYGDLQIPEHIDRWGALCQATVKDIRNVQDANLLYFCHHFFTHMPRWELDPSNRYSSVIQIALRMPELEPNEPMGYSLLATAWYSNWVYWRIYAPDECPRGEFANGVCPEGEVQLKKAFAVLRDGFKLNKNNPDYALAAGEVFFGAATEYKGIFTSEALKYFKVVEKKSKDKRQLIRTLSFMGQIYKDNGQRRNEIATYKKILKIDPNHKGARSLLDAMKKKH